MQHAAERVERPGESQEALDGKKLFHQHESKVRRPSVEDVFCRHQQGDYPFRQEFNNSQLEVREYFPHGFKGNFLLG